MSAWSSRDSTASAAAPVFTAFADATPDGSGLRAMMRCARSDVTALRIVRLQHVLVELLALPQGGSPHRASLARGVEEGYGDPTHCPVIAGALCTTEKGAACATV